MKLRKKPLDDQRRQERNQRKTSRKRAAAPFAAEYRVPIADNKPFNDYTLGHLIFTKYGEDNIALMKTNRRYELRYTEDGSCYAWGHSRRAALRMAKRRANKLMRG
jgi:hypothetical protein